MKAQLIGGEKVKQEIKLPVLARYKTTNDVVLFSANKVGTLVMPGNGSDDNIGHYSVNWVSVTDPCWEILPPDAQIVLQND